MKDFVGIGGPHNLCEQGSSDRNREEEEATEVLTAIQCLLDEYRDVFELATQTED